MLAQLFLEHGNAVVAIEPNGEMRAACEQLGGVWPGLTVKDATAESTGLEDASVDFVSVGRAWHWFDPELATQEFRRIIRPGGWVVLLSNMRRRDDSPASKAYEKVLMEFGRDYEELHRRTRSVGEIALLFPKGEPVREEIYGAQTLTLEEFLGQTQSLSVTPMPGDDKYAGMQTALREFFGRFQEDGLLRMDTICSLMACQV
jgi:SAM-dependent methyltransferase